MIVVENEEIYDEIRAFTSKSKYSYIVPVKIHMMDGKFAYLSIEICLDGHKEDLPVYPLNAFSGSDFRDPCREGVAKVLSLTQDKTSPEELCDMIVLASLVFGWMVHRLKIERSLINLPELKTIMKSFIDDVSSKDSEMLTCAIKETFTKNVNHDVYYGFYLAPNSHQDTPI